MEKNNTDSKIVADANETAVLNTTASDSSTTQSPEADDSKDKETKHNSSASESESENARDGDADETAKSNGSSEASWIRVDDCWAPSFVTNELILEQSIWVPTDQFNISAGKKLLATGVEDFAQWDDAKTLKSPSGHKWAWARKDLKNNLMFFDCNDKLIATFVPLDNLSWQPGPPKYNIVDAQAKKLGVIQDVHVNWNWSIGVPMHVNIEDLSGNRMAILSQKRTLKNIHSIIRAVDPHYDGSKSWQDIRMDPRVLILYSAFQFGARTEGGGGIWMGVLAGTMCCCLCCFACMVTKCRHHSSSSIAYRQAQARKRQEEEDALMTRPVLELDDGYESDQNEGKGLFSGCCSNKSSKPRGKALPLAPRSDV